MNRYEKRKKAIEAAIREQITEYKAIYKKAEDDDRDPTDDERLDIESHLKAIETLKTELDEVEENIKTLGRVDDLGREVGTSTGIKFNDSAEVKPGGGPIDRFVKSIGEQFIASSGYKSIQDPLARAGNWSSGQVEMLTKGTLTESATSGNALAAAVPQVVDGVVTKLFQPVTFASQVLEGNATTNQLRYIVEGTATSGAAGVLEGATKPESTLGLSTVDEPIRKIATILPISEEMLEDAAQVQSYVNGRLSLFVQIEEERQLLRGTASGAEVQGMLVGRNVPIYAGGTAAGNKAEQMFKAINGLRGSAFVEPDFLVIHPTDWQDIRLLKDNNGQLYGGGPFFGPYGGPQGPANGSGQISGPIDSLWNKPVVVTAAIGGAGTALVGTRSAAQVWRRGGLRVEASNSHSTYFAQNLVAIRAEERLGLAVYRPGAFVEVRLA